MQGTPLSHVTRHSAPGPNGLVAASACGFQNAKAAGFDADDFLAAAAPKEEKRGGTVLIASGDRDTFQLASDRTTIHYPVRAGETARIDPAEFRARYRVDPRQVRILSPCAVIPKGRRAGAIVGAESTRRPARRACDRLGRTIGRFRFNHVALEVGDIEEALAFYGRLFDFKLRGKSGSSAFIDLGDQFLALQKGRAQPADEGRHFGLVVDDKDAVCKALADTGIQPLPGPFLDFLDPWGNRIEIVSYENVQFTKAPNVLRGMGLTHLSKNEKAIKELTGKGMAPD